MNNVQRIAVAALSLSAAGFGGIAVQENFRSDAYVPVAGDRPTYGFGSTFRPDGTPVRPGDKIDPVSAIRLKLDHIAKDEQNLKRCVTAPMHQAEWDLLTDFAYQYGSSAACKSTLVKLTNAQQYAQACQQYARWNRVAGRDCSIRSNGCYGVHLRAQERTAKCLSVQ